MKLTEPQWTELRHFVADDDRRGFEALVQIILVHAEKLRRAERIESLRVLHRDSDRWIPDRV